MSLKYYIWGLIIKLDYRTFFYWGDFMESLVNKLTSYGYTTDEAQRIYKRYKDENNIEALRKWIERNHDFFAEINIRKAYQK